MSAVYEAKWTADTRKAHNLALQANPCYNKHINIYRWLSDVASILSRGYIWIGDASMDSLSPRSKPRKPPKICAHPGCDRVLSRHRHTHCQEHCKRNHSPETRAQMSASAKLRANTPEGRARMSKAAKAQVVNPFEGRKHTEEARAIIKAKRAQQVFSEESIKKQADAHRGKPSPKKGTKQPGEIKTRISTTLQSKREHLSQKAKDRYARETEEQRQHRLIPWIEAGRRQQDTAIEVYVAQSLDIQDIEYEPQKRIGYYIADFYIPSRNTVLEVNGCYWHGCESCGFNSAWHSKRRLKDKRRTTYLINKGYTVVVIWEHQLYRMMQSSEQVLIP